MSEVEIKIHEKNAKLISRMNESEKLQYLAFCEGMLLKQEMQEEERKAG